MIIVNVTYNLSSHLKAQGQVGLNEEERLLANGKDPFFEILIFKLSSWIGVDKCLALIMFCI